MFAPFNIPIHIGDERDTAAILDRLHHLADENRMNGGITDVVAHVKLQTYQFIFHTLTQLQGIQY